jgi:nicotinate-nucleotide adenylyltransferase
MERLVGVFGGSFDPPHWGHLILAEEARGALGLSRVLWVLTAKPPHKSDAPISPVEARREMVQAAIEGNPGFEFSPADIERPSPHFAVGTLHWLEERLPGVPLAYLMGSDSLRDLPTWHEPDQLLQACALLGVAHRPGVELDLPQLEERFPLLRSKLRLFEAPGIGISGVDIRRRVREGRSFRYHVPPAVAEIILRRGLYQ